MVRWGRCWEGPPRRGEAGGMAAGTACRAAAEGSGHRLCACAAAEPANSRRWSAADDGGEGATVGRRRGLDRSVQAGAARRPCVRRRPTGRPRAAAASDGLLARSLHRVWARLRARPLRRGAGGRAAGAAPWRLIAATLAVIAAVHLPGARGQTPHYVELNEQPELTNEVCSRLRVPHTAHRTHASSVRAAASAASVCRESLVFPSPSATSPFSAARLRCTPKACAHGRVVRARCAGACLRARSAAIVSRCISAPVVECMGR